jgi:hypothetical protein
MPCYYITRLHTSRKRVLTITHYGPSRVKMVAYRQTSMAKQE